MGRAFKLLTKSTAEVCDELLQRAMNDYHCLRASAWSLDPIRRKLSLVAARGLGPSSMITRDCSDSLSGLTVERKVITLFPDVNALLSQGRSPAAFVGSHGLKSMISIPVLNTSNLNQVLLVINLFPQDTLLGSKKIKTPNLERFAKEVAATVEGCMRDRCMGAANRLGIEVRRFEDHPTLKGLCKLLCQFIQDTIDCDSVLTYLDLEDQQRIVLFRAVGYMPTGRRRQLLNEVAEKVWSENREFLSSSIYEEFPEKEAFAQHATDEKLSGMLVPLRNLQGQAQGVICCVNRWETTSQKAHNVFTYDDIAVIESITEAFAPHLEIKLAEASRMDAVVKLAHELRVPVVAFRAVVERVQRECAANRYSFRFNHFDELDIYCEMMSRLLSALDIVRLGVDELDLKPRRTFLMTSIIAPAKRFISPLLVSKGFHQSQIHYTGFENIPALHLDPVQMTHVVFNLLDNAVKYFRGVPSQFRTEVVASESREGFEIAFRDFGVGIPEGFEEMIFHARVRGPNAYQHNVSGDGIGLYLVRAIVRKHGGDVRVRNHQNPTEVVIILPKILTDRLPRTAGEVDKLL